VYEYVHDYGTDNETITVQEFTCEVALKNIEAVRLVQDKLIRETSDRLNRRYNPPDEFLESLVAIDPIIVLFIDTMAGEHAPRYKVYFCKELCLFTNRQELVTQVFRDARNASITILSAE
jgi:hypothetical protein